VRFQKGFGLSFLTAVFDFSTNIFPSATVYRQIKEKRIPYQKSKGKKLKG
jgi:hypothetical protein